MDRSRLLIAARSHELGILQVGRVLPAAARRMVGPFIFLDHIGPLTLPAPVPRTADVRPHPHIGLATVTYLFEGEITHRDSLGIEQVIRPGEVNWMTAGRGISHSERFDGLRATGGPLHGLQAWVALPLGHEEVEPAFEHHGRTELQAREADGRADPADRRRGLRPDQPGADPVAARSTRISNCRPARRSHCPQTPPSARSTPSPERLTIDGVPVEARTLAVLRAGAVPSLVAREACTVMLLGGEPVGHRYAWWNFVSSRRERIEQAKQDWSAGRIPLPPADASEWIPLPVGA